MTKTPTKAILQNAAFVLGLLVLLLLTAEVFARTEFAQSRLPLPSRGMVHPHFDTKLSLLEALYAETGHLDCLYIGTSLVERGIAPEVVSRVYQTETGRPLTCFNFGIGGARASLLRDFSTALINRYHPHTLIIGVNAVEYTPVGIDLFGNIVRTPWIQYELGNRSIEGWLSHYSAAYQYLMGFRLWYGFRSTWEARTVNATDHSPYGQRQITYRRLRPLTTDEIEGLTSVALTEEYIVALQQTLELGQHGIQVVLAEMPISPSVSVHIEAQRSDFAARVEAFAADANTAFIPLDTSMQFSLSDFSDVTHLHVDGAERFSEWLGTKLAVTLSPPAGE